MYHAVIASLLATGTI